MKHNPILILLILLASCTATPVQPTPIPSNTGELGSHATSQVNLPNPASVHCQEQGYKNEIRTAPDGSQSGVCIFPDGSRCDEWAYYQGWWSYTHPVYGFTVMLPDDWIVDETTGADLLMSDHLLNLHPKEIAPGVSVDLVNTHMTFRKPGEDVRLWPIGVGQGEFIPHGALEIAGEPAQRLLLVCPTGEVTSIWYHQAEGSRISHAVIWSLAPFSARSRSIVSRATAWAVKDSLSVR